MPHKQFTVELRENVVLNGQGGSLGEQGSLDYLPGATLLGACAAHLYNELSEADAWQVFHSGRLRFGNALPLNSQGDCSYPIPFCLHYRKDELERQMLNHQCLPPDPQQDRQWRQGYLCLNGSVLNPTRQYRMKTAINPNTGRAAKSQLFGYNSLQAGQKFSFTLSAAEDFDADLFQQVVKTLTAQTLYLGRSRSAEYGEVVLQASDQLDNLPGPDSQSITGINLWLLSDTALLDEFGQPTVTLTPAAFGLPKTCTLDSAKTFIRTRRYAPFNGYRRRRELERDVLCAGSVVYFDCTAPLSTEDLQTLQTLHTQGIGAYRQNGCGRVWVNPALLAQDKIEPVADTVATTVIKKVKKPSSTLFRYMSRHVDALAHVDHVETLALAWLAELKLLYQSAHAFVGEHVTVGPSPTQWGQVMDAAKNSPSDTLLAKLIEADNAICKAGDAQWSQRVLIENEHIQDFRSWLQHKLNTHEDATILDRLVVRFARLATDFARTHQEGRA